MDQSQYMYQNSYQNNQNQNTYQSPYQASNNQNELYQNQERQDL